MRKKAVETCVFPVVLLLFLASGQAAAATGRIRVAAELANIRQKPDIGSIIIRQVPQGTILDYQSKEGDWYLVKLEPDESGMVSGYVHESLVMVVKPAPVRVKPEKREERKVPETVKPETRPPKPVATKPVRPTPPSLLMENRTALSFSGGGNYVDAGELNRGADGLARLYSDDLGVKGEGEVEPLRLSYIYGAEMSFPLTPEWSFILGGDFFSGVRESRVEYTRAAVTNVFITRPRIRDIPLRLALSYHPAPFLYFKSGLEYHFASCGYFYSYEREDSWQEWKGEASAHGLGFHGGLGMEWNLARRLALIAEITGRYARVKGFSGKGTFSDSKGEEATEEGRLYSYTGKLWGPNTYSLLFIGERRPSGAGVSDVREAEINLSGITLRVGLKIKF